MENVVLKSTPLFDLDRVEVYRGPQGTLFGRNTTAGIVRFTSMQPTEEFDARAQASYGSLWHVHVRRRRRRRDRAGRLRPAPPCSSSTATTGSTTRSLRATTTSAAMTKSPAASSSPVQPTEQLDILLNLHGRDLDGTSAIFRANVITPGSNGLNANYDRDTRLLQPGRRQPAGLQWLGRLGEHRLRLRRHGADLDHRLRDRPRARAAATSTAAPPASGPGLHPVRLGHAGRPRRPRPDDAGTAPRQRHRRPALLAGRSLLVRLVLHHHHGRPARLPAVDDADARQHVMGRRSARSATTSPMRSPSPAACATPTTTRTSPSPARRPTTAPSPTTMSAGTSARCMT